MHYYPEDASPDNLRKLIRQNVCEQCGRQLYAYLDAEGKTYIACSNQKHEGIAREYQPPREDYESNIRREIEVEKEHGREGSKALATIPKQGQLTQSQAMTILQLVYPDVPENEIIRTAILCKDFGLHPLMKELYIIPFGTGEKRTWSTVLGINATRKMMARMGSFSYIDNTPRVMTEQEQMEIFGIVNIDRITAITKLETKGGLKAQGYGTYMKKDNPYGMDKGNSQANMAFIRSERQAFSRLFPDAVPQELEVVDEAYVEGVGEVDTKTGEILEAEVTELPDEPEPSPEATESQPASAEGEDNTNLFPDSLINISDLNDQLIELRKKDAKTWSEESLLSYMRLAYKGVEGNTVFEIASKLDKGKAAHFTKTIQDALDKA